MSEEPRRSGRATKGQHNKNASSSPAPAPKPTKGSAKSKPVKKANEPDPQDEEGAEEEEEEEIRCICGNTNSKDTRAFIGCDACSVWQHNVCMGMPDEEEDVPEHYFCEECRPEEHQESLQSIARGDKPPIWEQRSKIWQNEKKMSKSRKSKSRGDDGRPGWLKNDVPPEGSTEAAPEPPAEPNGAAETSNKRKREEIKEEPTDTQTAAEDKPVRAGRQEKRRKSSTIDSKTTADTETALVKISQLPKDRHNVAQALNKLIAADIQQRVKSGLKLPNGHTAEAVGEHHAARIEYALHMNHGVGQPGYKQQFTQINANMKKNKVLIERLMDGSLTADELSTMDSKDMASEEQQRERAALKEALDRQAIAVTEEGPKYKQDHKGFHLIEEAGAGTQVPASAPPPAPTAPTPVTVKSGSPVLETQAPLSVETSKLSESAQRRASNQHLDMENIWAKTSTQSPTVQTGARAQQASVRRTSSIQPTPTQQNGTKDDADVDRMLEDDDQAYTPADGPDAVVWRGKLVQTNEDDAPIVNARFVAGRDLAPTVAWDKVLPQQLSIDGRLAKEKAEEYLCGLRWSSSSDVAVVSLTAYDNLNAFNTVFDYFRSRNRYAVVEKNKPKLIKDLYIMPVEVGDELPSHIGMLEHCTIKAPIEERLLLATFVVSRAPESPAVDSHDTPSAQHAANGHFPSHTRQSIGGGPAGSPITAQTPSFSPTPSAFPGNPYSANAQPQPQVQQPQAGYYPPPQQQPQPHLSPEVNQILGDLQFAHTAQMILNSAPLNRDQLLNLRTILNEDVATRTDFDALTKKLFSGTT